MKKISLYFFLCFLSLNALAQNETDNNKRVLPNYGHTIKFEVSNNYLIIAEGAMVDSFILNNDLTLKNENEASTILSNMHFEKQNLEDLYGQYIGTEIRNAPSLLNALIKRATELEGQRIIFSGNETNAVADAMYTPEPDAEESSFDTKSWLMVFLGILGGLLLGLLLGRQMKKKNTLSNDLSNNDVSSDDAVLKKTKTELTQIKQSLQQQLDFDKQYFNASFNTVIVPLEKALEAQDLKAITPLLIKAMTHYTAVTRFKLEKKQSFDLANMQIMMGNATYQKSDFPAISKNTSPDDIPNKLKALIALLKSAQANGVDESIVSGYKIENL